MTTQAVSAPFRASLAAAGERGLRAVAARVFARPRPYTVVSLGGPTLLCAVLEQRGLHAEVGRVRAALAPVMAQLEVDDVAALPAALDRFRGRPPDVVTGLLRSRGVASALRDGFRALGWGELVDLLGGWWPDPPAPVVVGELGERDRAARDEIAKALAGRVEMFREALVVDPAAWDMPPVDVPAAVRAQALDVLTARADAVAAVTRHPNRLGRLVGAVLVDRLEHAVALRGVTAEAEAAVVEAACVVAAVAESVTACGTGGPGVRSLAIPGRVEPPVGLGWWPSRWWPVLDAWGAASSRGRARVRTVWRLTPAGGDVALAGLLWALGSLGAVCAVGDRVRSPWVWRRRWARELDEAWGPVAEHVWALVQSVRPVGERSPCPFEGGMSRVAWGRSWRYGVLP